jgi:hypothetical protein
MGKNICHGCQLVNATTDETCRRCGRALTVEFAGSVDAVAAISGKRRLGERLLWILAATLLFLFSSYISLLLTSDPLDNEQRRRVLASVALLQQRGFSSEATMLTVFAKYRSTDNWWNKFLGHRDAYAATNFPFEVMTLYPEFFVDSYDDQERAAILLHESCHLFGWGEAAALEYVWRNKKALGWTEDRYGHTKVWNSTKELTINLVPELFRCGPDGKSDCVP